MKSIVHKGAFYAFLGAILVSHLTSRYWLTFIPIPQELGGGKTFTIDFKILVIVLLLTFLIIKTLWEIVSKHYKKEWKGVDMLFLCVLFIGLFFPMSKINKEDISKQENRTLAKWEPFLLPDHKINFDFGKDFNEWFNDRFRGRSELINLYSTLPISTHTDFITKDVMRGKDGWLFLGWGESIASYTNRVLFSNEELQSIDNYLREIDNYCKENEKNFYFFIAPDKSRIYGEYYPESIIQLKRQTRAEQLIDYIGKHSCVKVIYPKERLLSEKRNGLLYYKNNTHWNESGAYYGYVELMQCISKEMPNSFIYQITKNIEKEHCGDLYNMLPNTLKIKDETKYKVPDVSNLLNNYTIPIREKSVTNSNTSRSGNLLVFHDSFVQNFTYLYLSESFNQSKFIWEYDVKPHAMGKADVIVLEVVERYLPALVNKHIILD